MDRIKLFTTGFTQVFLVVLNTENSYLEFLHAAFLSVLCGRTM